MCWGCTVCLALCFTLAMCWLGSPLPSLSCLWWTPLQDLNSSHTGFSHSYSSPLLVPKLICSSAHPDTAFLCASLSECQPQEDRDLSCSVPHLDSQHSTMAGTVVAWFYGLFLSCSVTTLSFLPTVLPLIPSLLPSHHWAWALSLSCDAPLCVLLIVEIILPLRKTIKTKQSSRNDFSQCFNSFIWQQTLILQRCIFKLEKNSNV